MRATLITMTLAAALLASCDRGPSVDMTNATPEQVAAEVKKSGVAQELQKPGKWAVRTELVDLKAPGAPAGQLELMKKMMSQPVEKCVTADDLKQATALIGDNPAGCVFDHYKLSSGTIDGEAHCTRGDIKQHMVMKGTYTGDTTETTMTSEVSGGGKTMSMTMKIKAQRIGPC